jgi:hypothetical protein
LPAKEALDAVVLEDLDGGVEGAGVDLVGLAALDLDADPGVLDGALRD